MNKQLLIHKLGTAGSRVCKELEVETSDCCGKKKKINHPGACIQEYCIINLTFCAIMVSSWPNMGPGKQERHEIIGDSPGGKNPKENPIKITRNLENRDRKGWGCLV